MLALGVRKTRLDVRGLAVNVIPVALVAAATDARGRASVALAVPAAPGLDGLVLYAQFFIHDAGGALGLSSTRGLEIVLFAK